MLTDERDVGVRPSLGIKTCISTVRNASHKQTSTDNAAIITVVIAASFICQTFSLVLILLTLINLFFHKCKYCYFVLTCCYTWHLQDFCPSWERVPSHVALSFSHSSWGLRAEDVMVCIYIELFYSSFFHSPIYRASTICAYLFLWKGAMLGFSILPKDTSACRMGKTGIEVQTFW